MLFGFAFEITISRLQTWLDLVLCGSMRMRSVVVRYGPMRLLVIPESAAVAGSALTPCGLVAIVVKVCEVFLLGLIICVISYIVNTSLDTRRELLFSGFF